jgi:hypothetical protein
VTAVLDGQAVQTAAFAVLQDGSGFRPVPLRLTGF